VEVVVLDPQQLVAAVMAPNVFHVALGACELTAGPEIWAQVPGPRTINATLTLAPLSGLGCRPLLDFNYTRGEAGRGCAACKLPV
jgi:hypothetical protein